MKKLVVCFLVFASLIAANANAQDRFIKYDFMKVLPGQDYVKLETAFDWQKQHFKSLEAAYRTSPFFEYFEDTLLPIFTKKHTFLMDLNFETIEIVSKCLNMKLEFEKTNEYFYEVTDSLDFRYLANGKKDVSNFKPYTQVFGEKNGFINNLSVLDLLFNEGRFALDYLKEQPL